MINLKTKLTLFNLLSKLGFTVLLIIFLPWIVERLNLRQVDIDLVNKREKIIKLIENIGIEPFISSDSPDAFGSYNILKDEFISLEVTDTTADLNFIDVKNREIEDEEITYRVLNYTILVDGRKYLLEIGKSMSSIQYLRRNITKIILIFLAVIILITLFADLQYTRLILKPLEKITAKLKSISSPSIFDKTPVPTRTSDFVKLDNALRDLMIQINESFRKEKEITVNISHELLTPVSVIRSKLENIMLDERLNTETAGKIEESLRTLHRLQSLINSLLMIARIESNQYLMSDSFNIRDILNEIVDELSPLADDKGVIIVRNNGPDFMLRNANRSLVFSMFYNIINNALKNTPSGGCVILSTSMGHNEFMVKIEDTGKGMDKEQMDRLFSRFSAKRNNNGTGIGLAIAKSIADHHKIDITVSSSPDKGTVFSLFFPENS
jgi:signal transduction histidine kinase